MYKISSPIWYVVIGIVALAAFYFIGRNSREKNAIRTISIKPTDDQKKEYDREAIKRDFNDLNSLITELKEPDNSLKPQNLTK